MPLLALVLGVMLGTAVQAQVPGVSVAGVVQDQTGAVLAGATVELLTPAGAIAQTTAADAVGAFRFDRVGQGPYQLRATFEGFKPATARVRVSTRAPSAQKLVLDLASISQEITVSNVAPEVHT